MDHAVGDAQPATSLIGELENKASKAILMEDYCISIEHSIEFQVVFLQYLFGPSIRVLPILCGAYGRSIYEGECPRMTKTSRRFWTHLGR